MRPNLSTLIVLLVVVAGCAEDPKSPSRVESLRILGLKPTPTNPMPGDTLALELLWTDATPYCSRETPCGPGSTCTDGRCVRNEETEILWLVFELAAWEPSDLASIDVDELTCVMDRCPDPIPCTEDSECPGVGRCDDGFCVPCLSFGPALFCCGRRGLDRIDLLVPSDLEPPEPNCELDSALNASLVYQVQVQVCAGGRIDLCPDPGALTFGCVGDGAQSVTATSRIDVLTDPSARNTAPIVESPTFSLEAWDADRVFEVSGCHGGDCTNRECATSADCVGGQICSGSLCREEVAHRLGDGAVEAYLEVCDEPGSCESDADCPARRVCRDGLCHRIESPFAGYFATAGSINPARDILDNDGDGRPDQELVYSRWLPPVLDECGSADDPCTFGVCDPAAGWCVGDVMFWVVVRDGRGGQDWIERTLRIVP